MKREKVSLDGHEAVEEDLEVVHVHVRALHVVFSDASHLIVYGGFSPALIFILFQLLRHVLDFDLQIGTAHLFSINLLCQIIQLKLKPVRAHVRMDNRRLGLGCRGCICNISDRTGSVIFFIAMLLVIDDLLLKRRGQFRNLCIPSI